MEELMIVANVAIIFGVVYKLFELFVGKKERMMLIEKLSSEELMKGGTKRPALPLSTFTFSSLRFGCFLAFRLFDAWLGIRTFSRILYRFGNM